MGLKDKMMDSMMGKMSKEEKQEMMNGMMEKFFADMTAEDKQNMMKEMMPKMMGDMSGGGMMGNMMGMMMGGKKGNEKGGFSPMDMCKKMMNSIEESKSMASFATPELRGLFSDWLEQVNLEIMEYIKENKSADPEEIANKLKISLESTNYLLARLAGEGKINIQINQSE